MVTVISQPRENHLPKTVDLRWSSSPRACAASGTLGRCRGRATTKCCLHAGRRYNCAVVSAGGGANGAVRVVGWLEAAAAGEHRLGAHFAVPTPA